MTKEDLLKLKEFIANLPEEDKKERDIYLKRLASGEYQGPPVGYPSIDKPWMKYYTDDNIRSDIPYKTAYDYIFDKNIDNMNRNAFDFFGRKITYKEFFDNIQKTEKALLNYGIKKGDIVSIIMPSFPETFYLFYALSRIGAVSNMIDPRANVEGIKGYIEETNSKLVFIIDIAEPKVNAFKNDLNLDVVTISPAESLPPLLKMGYKLKNKNKKSANMEWHDFMKKYYTNDEIQNDYTYEKDTPVVIVHTGGTTGVSKGVILTNENINSASYQCEIAGYDFQSKHNWLNIMPPFIAYGVGNGLHLPLACGMEVILIPSFDPDKFDKLLIKYKPNHMVGVPSHYGHLMESPKLKKKDLSFIIAPTVGGDKMDEELEKKVNAYLKERNCDYMIVKGYGLTEVNAAVAACTSNESNAIGSVGIPFPKTNISIFEPGTENELPYGEMGEIYISGPNTMLGYYQNEEETNNVVRIHSDGTKWVHSGDIGRINENGNLYIIDRIKRMIIRPDGFKVFPAIIEDVINKDENVAQSKVVAVRDYNYSQGKLPFAHIILKNNNVDIEQEKRRIYRLCEEQLPEYCQLFGIEFDESFPLTSIGKVDYRKLEEIDDQKVKTLIKR